MIEIFLCHAAAEREVAQTIAARLERSTGLKLWLHCCGEDEGELIPVAWDIGLASAGILLLLSPEAVPRTMSRSTWQSLLDHVEQMAPPAVASVLVRECPIPLMLRRKSFFRWSDEPGELLRELERWVMDIYGESEARTFAPAALPRFAGRDAEIKQLWRTLVDEGGRVALVNPEAGSGKTSLAQQFAHAASGHFRDVLWVDCGGRSETFIAGEIARRLGPKDRRVLVVLDDVRDAAPVKAVPEGLAGVIVTTRRANLRLPARFTVMRLEAAGRAGAEDLPEAGSAPRWLWGGMSVCLRNGFSLELAAQAAGLSGEDAEAACARLVAMGLADPVDAGGRRFRLSKPLEEELEPFRRRHAEALYAVFREHRTEVERCAELAAELEQALEWAIANNWHLATRLARHGFQFLSAQAWVEEGALLMDRLREAAVACGDTEEAANCEWELSWIRSGGELRRPAPAGEQLQLGLF